MLELAGGSLWLLLVVAAVASLAFGLGLPTSASYILVALMGAPALVNLGVPLIAAHFFVFYFANVSAITPPVAVCCLVASKIAGGGFFRTSFIAVRLGLPGFVLPFLFVAHPEILGIDASIGWTALVSAMALLGVAALNVIIEGHLLRPMAMWERAVLLPTAGRAPASGAGDLAGRDRAVRRGTRVAVARQGPGLRQPVGHGACGHDTGEATNRGRKAVARLSRCHRLRRAPQSPRSPAARR